MSIHRVSSTNPYDSNIYLIKGDRNVLIDTGTGTAQSYVSSQIREILDGEKLDIVILTHCHADHAGGLGGILGEFGSEAYAMAPDSDCIRKADPKVMLADMFRFDIRPQPVKDVKAGDRFDIGDHRLLIVPSPGHTAGGLCVYDEVTGSLFSGDTIFTNGVGRCDFPSGDYSMLRESVMRISNIDISGVYPGHGDCSVQHGSDCVKTALRMIGE